MTAKQAKSGDATSGFVEPGHDHKLCVADALALADARCAEEGARLTDQRRRVLELVWLSHQPIRAYDILDQLRADGQSSAPPTVYRALEFLVELGLVHRIESLNAYVGCPDPGAAVHAHDGAMHGAQFLICRTCGSAAELHDPDITNAVAAASAQLGFQVDRATIEVSGLCPNCQSDTRR